MKKYIAPELEISEVSTLDTVLFATSPVDDKPSNDKPGNIFSKEFLLDDEEEDEEW